MYGTLQPDGPNEHILAAIGGEYMPAAIKGNLIDAGWGSDMGYPGLVLDENGNDINGYVFISSNLSAHWAALDAFEGEGYERTIALVTLFSGEKLQANVYVLSSVLEAQP